MGTACSTRSMRTADAANTILFMCMTGVVDLLNDSSHFTVCTVNAYCKT